MTRQKDTPLEAALRNLMKAVGKVKPWGHTERELAYWHAVKAAYDRADYILNSKAEDPKGT